MGRMKTNEERAAKRMKKKEIEKQKQILAKVALSKPEEKK